MNKFRISTRLTLSFGILLLFSIISTSFAIMNTRSNADATRRMMEQPLAKERLVADWNALLKASISRTSLIARSSDATLATNFSDVIADGVQKATALTKEIESLLSSEDEKNLFKEIQQARAAYVSAKESVLKLRKSGDDNLAVTEFNDKFIPASKVFEGKVAELLAIQRKSIDETSAAIMQSSQHSTILVIIMSLLLIAIGVVISYFISISITVPLKNAVYVADKVASGDLTTTIDQHASDEIGDLMRALGRMNDSLRTIVSQVKTSAHSITSAAGEISTGNMDLSNRTEQQAGSLEETAASIEELTATVKQNAENAHHADEMAGTASEVALKGGEVVSKVVDTMRSINDSSKKIVDIISVIDGIAFQTNILALNAAVEAARAGEQGRGFAVVASEVRNLAQRSASAAKEIKGLISDSVENVNAGTKLVDEAGASMDRVVTSIRDVKEIISEINIASKEQSGGIEQVNQAIIEIDNNTQQNSALVEQAAAAAQSMLDQAAELAKMVDTFKIDSHGISAPNLVRPARRSAISTSNSIVKVAQRTRTATTPRIAKKTVDDKSQEWEEF